VMSCRSRERQKTASFKEFHTKRLFGVAFYFIVIDKILDWEYLEIGLCCRGILT
jgi:hypothetical protein